MLKAMSGNLLVPFPVVKVESIDLSLFVNLKRKSILGLESEMGSLRAAGSVAGKAGKQAGREASRHQ